MPPVLLTIAASDPLGGAGVQADLATFSALGVHGASALTAVTAQSLTAVTASDPVMVDGRGTRFVSDDVEDAYRRRLFPLARAITPNRGEAELLAGTSLPSAEAVLDCAPTFQSLGADAVVVTGGAFDGDPDDAVITASGDAWIVRNTRIATDNVRGSGCTFSAALAANLALGRDLRAAVSAAGRFVREAIGASAVWMLDGPGPVSHAQG